MPLIEVTNGTAVSNSAAGTMNQSHTAQKRTDRSQIDSNAIRNGQLTQRSNQSRTRRESDTSSRGSLSSSLLSEEQKVKALGLKMAPPNILGTLTTKQPHVSHQAPLRSHHEAMSDSSGQSGEKHQTNAFDDTASLSFEDSTIDENEEVTQVLTATMNTPRQNEPSVMRRSLVATSQSQPTRLRLSGNTQFQQGRSPSAPVREPDSSLQGGRTALMHSNRAISTRSREPQTATKDRITQNMDLDIMQAAVDTPSKSRSMPPQHFLKSQSVAKTVKFTEQHSIPVEDDVDRESQRSDSPDIMMPRNIPIPGRDVNQTPDTRRTIRSATPPQTTRVTGQDQLVHLGGRSNPYLQAGQQTNTPHLNSESPNLSEARRSVVEPESMVTDDVVQSKQSTQKRPREDDLDYDVEALTKKSFHDLYKEGFTFDPQNSPPKSSYNSSGQLVTLAQRLENLTQMDSEEQKKMFQKQNDDEWAETGTWFISKFQQDLKRLMEARLDRRKVSMLYEHEIRKRHKDVEWCSAGVVQELNELKSKGTDLIRTRPGSRNGTPLRERS